MIRRGVESEGNAPNFGVVDHTSRISFSHACFGCYFLKENKFRSKSKAICLNPSADIPRTPAKLQPQVCFPGTTKTVIAPNSAVPRCTSDNRTSRT